jgi:acetyltransferase-like isoleucine patch superfamily enzyme
MGGFMDSFYRQEELSDLGFKSIGKNVKLSKKAVVYNADKIEIGNNVRIDDFCILSGRIIFGDFIHIAVCTRLSGSVAGLTLKDFSGVSYNSTIMASGDDYSGEVLTNPTIPWKFRKILPNPVVLEKHALVGTNCVVLPGVTIGEGAAIGAMSLVLRDVEPWSIYFGIPARKVRERERRILELEKQLYRELAEGTVEIP